MQRERQRYRDIKKEREREREEGKKTHTHTPTRTRTRTRTHAPVCTHMCAGTRAHAHKYATSARTRTHPHMHTHMPHVRTHAHTRTCTHVRTYTHTHTHTPAGAPGRHAHAQVKNTCAQPGSEQLALRFAEGDMSSELCGHYVDVIGVWYVNVIGVISEPFVVNGREWRVSSVFAYLWLEWTRASHCTVSFAPLLKSVCFQWFAPVFVSPPDTWMEEHSLEPLPHEWWVGVRVSAFIHTWMQLIANIRMIVWIWCYRCRKIPWMKAKKKLWKQHVNGEELMMETNDMTSRSRARLACK